jgi:hypothetical protein
MSKALIDVGSEASEATAEPTLDYWIELLFSDTPWHAILRFRD